MQSIESSGSLSGKLTALLRKQGNTKRQRWHCATARKNAAAIIWQLNHQAISAKFEPTTLSSGSWAPVQVAANSQVVVPAAQAHVSVAMLQRTRALPKFDEATIFKCAS